jgi:hypothetical protein
MSSGARLDQRDAGVWLDVVAAVDYLGTTHRLGFTLWEAVEEAIRWWTIDYTTPTDDLPDAAFAEFPWDDPDPLRSTLERLLGITAPVGVTDGHDLAAVLSDALHVWVDRMAILYNDGRTYSHPAPRNGWPTIASNA